MKDVLGIINLNESREGLKEITVSRSVAAVPIGGRYRIIDFALSNMVNAGMKNIGLINHTLCRSLMDHIRSKKEWGLDRKKEGLFILSSSHDKYQTPVYKGDLEDFYSNIDYLNRSKESYVLITGSDIICNIDFKKLKNFHFSTNADITLVYKEEKSSDADFSRCKVLTLDENNMVQDLEINPKNTKSNKIMMEMYFLKKSLLIDIISSCVSRGRYDFVQDGIVNNIGKLKINGFAFDGYISKINCIESYYKFNMDLLQESIWQELFFNNGLIYTKIMDEGPAKYLQSADVSNSLIANGCIIEGKVENCILFRGVKVHKGAHIKNSIIMQKCHIGEDSIIENVIMDKDVKIQQDRRLIGDRKFPIVIGKRTVV